MKSSAVTPQTILKPGANPPQPRRFTFEEYCAYEDSTDNRYELVRGYLRLMTLPAGWHIAVCEFLVYVFNSLIQEMGTLLWAVREVGVRTGESSSRIADICVNWQTHWQQMFQPGEKGIFLLDRTPLLVVEVTSTNEKEDYEEKHQEYAAIGIPEYWIVNGRRECLQVCTSAYPGGPYVDREFVKGEQIVSKVLPQLELTVDEVLNPPPVSQLIERDQARQAAEIEQAQQQATASEQRAAALEAMLARYQAQFGKLSSDAEELQ